VGLTLISLSDDNGRCGADPSVLDQRKRTSRRQSAPARAARFGPRVDLLISIGMTSVLISRIRMEFCMYFDVVEVSRESLLMLSVHEMRHRDRAIVIGELRRRSLSK
jgi:hypothetical protein